MAVPSMVMKKLSVSVAAAGTQVPLTTDKIKTPFFEIIMLNASAATNFYIGDSTVDSNWIPRVKNQPYAFTSAPESPMSNVEFDLSKIWVDADNTASFVVQYLKMAES